MKKYINYILLLIPFVFIYSCSSDDDNPILLPEPVTPSIDIKLSKSFDVDRYRVVEVDPVIDIQNGENIETSYIWSITIDDKDSIISDQKTLQFISPRSGKYNVDLTVRCGKTAKNATTSITVATDDKRYHARVGTVTEYCPAPDYTIGWSIFAFSDDEALAQAQDALGNEFGIYLGTFGGYVVTKFDHTVINSYNKRDFIITTELFDASSKKYNSPLAVMIAYDKNQNGVADEDEWFEIAGSEHHKSTTIKNYEMTYFKPDNDKAPVNGIHSWQYDMEYLKWTSNTGESGYIPKTEFGRYSDYFPQWKTGDSYTLKGTKLAIPTKDVSDGDGTSWNIGTYEWGYGGIKDSRIDISWAVDKNGNKVHLPGIDFVKVYIPTFAAVGDEGYVTSLYKYTEDLNLVSVDK